MSRGRRQVNMLLLQIKDGDKSKMEDLFNLTYDHLKFIALYYLYDKRYYKDVVHEAYFRAYNYIQNFNVFKDGYNWLCRIVQNVAINFNKENSKYVLCEQVENDVFYFDDKIDELLSKDEFYQLVKNLPTLDRRIIYYRFIQAYSYGRIADKLGRSKSFIYKRVKIITEKLRSLKQREQRH